MTKQQLANLEEQLREAIQQTGLSLHEIGRRSGVSQPVISRFVRGDRSLTLPIASKLCQALGLRLCGVDADDQAEDKPASAKPATKKKTTKRKEK